MDFKRDVIPGKKSRSSADPSTLWPVRAFLIGLVLACLLPGLVGTVMLFVQEYRDGRTQLERNTIQTARALAQTVDGYLFKAQAIAQALSTARSLTTRDFADFHRRARLVLAEADPGTNIVLSDESGQQILNTLQEFGARLPRHGNPELVRRVIAGGKPVISNLYIGAVLQRPVMSIDVPVTINGKVTYVLSVGIQPVHFNTILQTQALPPDWVVAIFDPTGTIIARTHAAEQFVGKKGTSEYIERITKAYEGAMDTRTKEGIPVFSVFSRSPATNWSVGIGIPRKALEAELMRPLSTLALGMTGLFLLTLALAWFMGERIARSIRGLTAPALALGSGEAATVQRIHIKEAAEVATAIRTTADLLSRRTSERDLAREELEKHRQHLEIEVAERTKALKETLEALAERERFIKAVTDNLPGLVSYWDADLRCRFANKPYIDWFGKTPQEMQGIHQADLLGERLFALTEPHTRGVLRGERQTFERRLVKPSGEVGHTLSSYIPDIDSAGRVIGFHVLVTDVTELKLAELRLQELNAQMASARDHAEAASRAKTEFVANMSHEIRTPMNAILGLSRLLEESPLGEQERDYAAHIQLSARSLMGILNDILDFSKIEAGRLELEHTPFSLDEVVRNTSVIVSANARDKGIRTIVDTAPDIPSTLVGDPLRLQQVLLNLAGNAVKFTERGEVVLSMRKLAETEADVTLEFSVRDTGIGIAPEHHERLFESFSQADNSTSRRYGGTGLGLAICHRLVALMGGAISFDSRPGLGSVFRFTAVFGKGQAEPVTCPKPPATPCSSLNGRLTGLRALLVEDNEINQKVASQILRKAGAMVEIVGDGQAAVDRLAQEGERFDAVLMDVQTPIMDGYEATRLIRKQSRFAALPIIAMTANAMADDREKALQAGMNAHVAKPIDVDELIATLCALVPGLGTPAN